MALKNIAVEDMELDFTPLVDVDYEVQTPASTNSIIDDKGIYAGQITVRINTAKFSGGTFVSADPCILTPTAQYNEVDSNAVLLEGDKSSGLDQFRYKSGDSVLTSTYTCTVKKAGQEVVQGD